MVISETIIDRMVTVLDGLSPAERRAASYILKHSSSVSGLDAREVAEASEVSAATITRLVRRLGCSSYSQFRVELARAESQPASDEQSPSAISMDDVAASLAYIARNKTDELAACARAVDAELLTQAVRLIQGANLVVFVGIGTSLSYAQLTAFRLSQFGIRAIAPSTSDAGATFVGSLDTNDCVVFVSNSGDSKRLQVIMDNCNQHGVHSIVITGNPTTELAQRGEVCLSYPLYDHLFAEDFIFSISSMNFVVEALLLLLLHDSPEASRYLDLFRSNIASEKRDVHYPFRAQGQHVEGFSKP